MKKWFGMFFIFGELLTPEIHFLVQDFRHVEGFDFQIEVVTNNPDIKIIADCQSFINGIHGYVREGELWSHQWGIPVSEEKCDYLSQKTVEYSNEGRDFCLGFDLEKQTYQINLELDQCL